MTSFAFLLVLGLATAATLPDDKKTSIKVFGVKEFDLDEIYKREYKPVFPTEVRVIPPTSYTLYPPYVGGRADLRGAPLSDISEKPVVVLIPDKDANLEARLCAYGIACLADVPVIGRSALLFGSEGLNVRRLQELGVPEMPVKSLILPEGTKLSVLARANYLLLTDKDADNFRGSLFKDIGDVEVGEGRVRVLNAPYKDNAYEEVIKEINLKKIDKINN